VTRPAARDLSRADVYFPVPRSRENSLMKSSRVRFGTNRRVLPTVAGTFPILFGPTLPILRQAQAQTDPLPSWNDRPNKRSITDFVARITRQG
jgi:hypothetical protein